MNIPKIRIKGFEGDWETCKLSNIARRVTRKNTNLESRLPLTISSIDGLVSQINYFNNIVASSNLRGYYLLKIANLHITKVIQMVILGVQLKDWTDMKMAHYQRYTSFLKSKTIFLQII